MSSDETNSGKSDKFDKDNTGQSDKSKISISYSSSFKTWIKFKFPKAKREAEPKVLSFLPFYPEPDATRKSKVINTPINKGKDWIHEFYVENTVSPREKSDHKHIVIIHGYGAALGFFIKTMDILSSIPGVKVHAIDMLGFGLSSRPKFPKLRTNTVEEVLQVEDFFTDSIEEWRKKRKIDNFMLIGHSLDGYISCAYILKYNHQSIINKLILISPVGVQRNVNSLLKDENYEEGSSKRIVSTVPIAKNRMESLQVKIFSSLWNKHLSFFSFLRVLGPFSSRLISGWSLYRFRELPEEEVIALHEYVYQIFLLHGSGEYAATRLLAPFAVARLPLLDRLPKHLAEFKIDTLLMYGDKDWMDKEGGEEMNKEIKECGGSSRYCLVEKSGHHIYLDNPEVFHTEILEFLGLV